MSSRRKKRNSDHILRENPGVDVCIEEMAAVVIPECPHGPTLLFQRYLSHNKQTETAEERSTVKRFFACSAYRDRKLCNFYQDAYEKQKANRVDLQKQINFDLRKLNFTNEEFQKRLNEVESYQESERQYCQSCDLLLLKSDSSAHNSHYLFTPITEFHLKNPSKLMLPIAKNECNAQFLFTDNSAEFFMSMLQQCGYSNIVCIGAPRIHEHIQCSRIKDSSTDGRQEMNSILLDIDERFAQFFSPIHYLRFNMFNNFFFDAPEAKKTFDNFISLQNVAIIMDPPFGGLVEALAHTIKTMMSESQEHTGHREIPVFWIFPYFMESKLKDILPNFTMLDYEVDYENHRKFHNESSKKSPVRIFTNIPAEQMRYLVKDGYKFCETCRRHVRSETAHCDKCNACTCKNGEIYRHCDSCGLCVKYTREHCNKCKRCQLPNHVCGRLKNSQCHICGDEDHKRAHCPQNPSNKLKMSKSDETVRKKRRTDK